MIIRKNTKFGLLLAIFFLVACNNTEDLTNKKIANYSTVSINIVEGYYEDLATTTRVGTDNQKLEDLPVVSQISDCSVSTYVEGDNDTSRDAIMKTRAITTPTHYKVHVYEGSTRVGEFSGVIDSNNFTPDAGSSNHLRLKRNTTYTLVCFNDDVVSNGNNLEVSLSNAETARIGLSTFTTSADNTTEKINIIAKHAGARVRTKIMGYKHFVKEFKATLSSTIDDIPTKVSFNPLTNRYTTLSSAAFPAVENDSPLSSEEKYRGSGWGGYLGFTSPGPWHYVLPGTNVKHLQMDITEGQIYWKNIVGKIPELVSKDYMVNANGTYSAQIRTKPIYTYLFSDGTTGSLTANPNKTAVAVVVDADQRLAAAIEEAGNGKKYLWQTEKYGNSPAAAKIINSNWMGHSDYTFSNGESGYDNTWDASTSSSSVEGNKVRGENEDFPAFYAAAHFVPSGGVTGSLVGKKWFLPSALDYFYAIVNLGFTEKSEIKGVYKAYRIYGNLFQKVFTQAGGKPFANDVNTRNFWTSTAIGTQGICPSFNFPGIDFASKRINEEYKVRAFIKY